MRRATDQTGKSPRTQSSNFNYLYKGVTIIARWCAEQLIIRARLASLSWRIFLNRHHIIVSNVQITCVDVSNDTGKIAVAYENKVLFTEDEDITKALPSL